MDSKLTLIKNTSFVVAYDGSGHVLIKNGEVAFKGNEIVYVGKSYPANAERPETTVDAENGLVIPGFVNIHCHIYGSPLERGFFEDTSNPWFYMSGLYDSLQIRTVPPEEQMRFFRFSTHEALRKGSTTVFDMGMGSEEMIRAMAETGVRAYVAPASVCASWSTDNGHAVKYNWDVDRGYARLENTIRTFEKFNGSYDDRVRIALYPGQVDTCTPEFFRDVRKAADETGMRVQVHAAQAIVEYQQIVERYGTTPAAFLDSCGLSGPDVMYGHYIFPSRHTVNAFQLEGELELIASTGTTVAHCPWVFCKDGTVMESVDRYIKMGINVGLGTDSTPQDMLAEMKLAAVCGKIAERTPLKATAATVFNAATLGGAKALGRDDLGRLARGAKADIVIVDTNNSQMCPLRDPIKALVYSGMSSDFAKIFVDGELLVENGRLLKEPDEASLRRDLQQSAEAMYARVKDKHWNGKSDTELAPMSFPVVDSDSF